MLVITGATGALNGATVEHLLEQTSARDLVLVVRDPAKAERFADRGVIVRQGDYADPATLDTAFAGADRVLLVSASDPGADAVSLHRSAIDAAVAAGAQRILYTSHQGASPDSAFRPCRDHAATEQLLADSGVAWTSLRNGFYAHTLNFLLGPWRQTGVLALPADGPTSWTAREDSAEAAARILASPHPHDGPATLTAGAAVTLDDVAGVASDLSGRPVTRVVVEDEEWLAAQVAAGTPAPMAQFTLGIFRAARAGGFAGVDPLLGDLLGRSPRTVRDLLTTG